MADFIRKIFNQKRADKKKQAITSNLQLINYAYAYIKQ